MQAVSQINTILDALFNQGWSIIDHCLPNAFIPILHAEIEQAYQTDELHKAKIGQALLQQESIRGDLIKWIDPTQETSPAFQAYIDFLQELQLHLNRDLQLGLKEFELHYALYLPGRFYQRHVDQFAQKKSRRVSFILYLNQDWDARDGGLLKLYDQKSEHLLTTVTPEANRFVCFLSDMPHEISLTQRKRLSITGWFKIYL